MSIDVKIKNVTKKYGDFKAVNNVSIDIKQGELFTLLGPSGCGKTTLLRMIAGFNSVDGGEIYFGDKLINDEPAYLRDIGMVFQNYAIFPHMTIFENVAYGLKSRKIQKAEIERRVTETLDIVQISHLRDRMPSDMSGGQQQRVALARAIVIEPKILLMDEPLSNLDAKLRVQMRTMIKKLQNRLGITTVYVTHDQEEALAISDRIAIMKDGEISQMDKPEIVYKKPSDSFVANFIGTSIFLEGKAHENSEFSIDKYKFKLNTNKESVGDVLISVRPEQFILTNETDNSLKGEIVISTFLGDYWYYEIETDFGQVIEVHEYTKDYEESRKLGSTVQITFDLDKINIFGKDGTEAIV